MWLLIRGWDQPDMASVRHTGLTLLLIISYYCTVTEKQVVGKFTPESKKHKRQTGFSLDCFGASCSVVDISHTDGCFLLTYVSQWHYGSGHQSRNKLKLNIDIAFQNS